MSADAKIISLQDCYSNPHRLSQTPNNASQMPYLQHNPNQGSQLHGPPTAVARGYINSLQKGFAAQQSVPPFSSWRQNSVNKEEHYGYHHGENLYSSGEKPHLQLLTHQPQIHPEKPPPPPGASNGIAQPEYHPEVIAIHVKSDRRPSAITDHCGEPIYGTSSFQAPSGQPAVRNTQSKWLDDGETTPTNEVDARASASNSYSMEMASAAVLGNSTLPRLMKHKTPPKTVGLPPGMDPKASPNDSNSLDITYQNQCNPATAQAQWQQHQSASLDGYKSLPKNMGRFQSTFGARNNGMNPGTVGVRQPPPPPRRSSSTIHESRQDTFSTFHPTAATVQQLKHQQSSSSWCSDDTDLPAPPPPEDLALLSDPSACKKPSASSTASLNNSTISTSSSTSLTSSSNNAAAISTTNLSDYHHHYNNTYASNTSTNAVAYNSNNNCSTRIHPTASGRLRDPSPGASDSDLTTTFATVGVRRNGSDASFKVTTQHKILIFLLKYTQLIYEHFIMWNFSQVQVLSPSQYRLQMITLEL